MRIVRASPLPPSVTGTGVVLFGDSLTGANDGYETVDNPSVRGYFNWARGFLGDSLDLMAVAGVGGETTTDMLARVDAAAANDADVAIVCAGANDVTQAVVASTTIGNIDTIVQTFVGAGMHVILTTVPPTEGADTAAEQDALLAVNDHIRGLHDPAAGVTIADIYPVLADGAPNVVKAGMAYDTVHWTEVGAAHVGRVVADALAPLLPVQVTEWHGPASAANIHGNPLFEESGSGWTAYDGTASYVPSAQHDGNVALLTLAGSTGTEPRLQYIENIADGRFAVGDSIIIKADVEWDLTSYQAARDQATVDVRLLARKSDAAGSAVTGFRYAMQSESGFRVSNVNGLLQGRGVWRTAPYTVEADIDRLYMRFGVASAETGVVKCHRFAAYKV